MIPISRNGKPVETIFDLLGKKENDLTAALGWSLSQVPSLAAALVHAAFSVSLGETTSIELQRHGEDGGYTDIEVEGANFQLIIEAKIGWSLPLNDQLERYASRIRPTTPHHAFLVLSDCSLAYARRNMPQVIGNIPIRFLSWHDVRGLCSRAGTAANNQQKYLLRQLSNYLTRTAPMQDQNSNSTFVVSLNDRKPDWSSLTWIQIVEQKGRYFHQAMAGNWPKVPPNYIGFRYGGRLQRIHHVESVQMVRDMHEAIPEIDSARWLAAMPGEWVVYTLGPLITPPPNITSHGLFRAAHAWAALDLLLTSTSIVEAARRTKRRHVVDEMPLEP